MSVRDIVQAAAGVGGGANPYIEDVFSTYLYTGNGSTQTITNGIDLDGEGGLVWIKKRSATDHHFLFDTERGAYNAIYTSLTAAQFTEPNSLTGFNSNGFGIGSNGNLNLNTATFASWTFRKAPKFFDVVTYTGTGSARTVSHNLGSVPGCIIVKRTDTTGDWQVYHRANTANPETDYLVLNSTAGTVDSNTRWNDTLPTDSVFTVGTEATVNASGGTYVAYLFAHDAGGFGDDGLQNVISCGSYAGNGSTTGPVITLGWEPQWLLVKRYSGSGNSWNLFDTMRGFSLASDLYLQPNNSNAEAGFQCFDPTPTGFNVVNNLTDFNGSGESYIYIAIRRGPMKTPTSGTEVYGDVYALGEPSTSILTTENGVLADMVLHKPRMGGTFSGLLGSRLLGRNNYLITTSTGAQVSFDPYLQYDNNNYAYIPAGGYANNSGGVSRPFVIYSFKRAPGFFDVVCYTGTSTAGRSLPHNLGVAPEFIITKSRSAATSWYTWVASSPTKYLELNNATDFSNFQIITAVSASDITLPADTSTNGSGITYIAYLFATLAGVSKVGSYTGTGTTLQVDCGFSAGARFVMIKRTSATNSDWYVWDSARGIVAGNDPYWLINSTADQVTSTDYIDPYSAGFEISSTAPAAINASGGNFIFLAIA